MKKVVITIALLIVIVAGLASFLLFRGMGVSIEGVELYVDLKRVTEAETPIEVILYANNKYPVNVKIAGGNLKVLADGLSLIDLEVPSQEFKQGLNKFTIYAMLNNALLDDFWYQHLSRDERSNIIIDGSIIVDTLIGRISVPLRISKPVETRMFPVEQVLNREYDAGPLGRVVVRSVKVELASLTPSLTQLNIYMTIENKLIVPLYVNGIVFKVRSEGMVVLGEGEQAMPKSIAPNEVDTIAFKAHLDNTKIPSFWCEHIKNREKSTIYIDVWLKVNIGGRTIELFKERPLSIAIKFETNIFKYE